MANTTSGSAASGKFDRRKSDRLTFWGTVHGASVAFFDQLEDLDMGLFNSQQEGVWDVFGLLHSMAHDVFRQQELEHALKCEKATVNATQLGLIIDTIQARWIHD